MSKAAALPDVLMALASCRADAALWVRTLVLIADQSLLFQSEPLAGPILPLRGPCGVGGIGFVDQLTRVLAATFCANEYLDFDIKGRIVWLNTFEEQLTVAMFAVHGWQRLNEVAHVLPPFVRQASQRAGDAKKGPVNSDFEESPTR